VLRSGGEGQQDCPFTQLRLQGYDAGTRNHQARGSPTEEASHRPETARPGYEDQFTGLPTGAGARLDHLPHGFVARNQGVAHAGKGRHAARPEEALSAGADATPVDVDNDIALARVVEDKLTKGKAFRLLQHDSSRVHDVPE
jgi:hypothetical protein